MSYEPPFVATPAIDALCREIGELVGKLPSSSPLATSVRLHRELRISTIHSSLVIEGNRLSQAQATAVLSGKRVLGPAKDIREVENAQRAYDALGVLNPTNEKDLLRAHGMMMEGLTPDAERLRNSNVGVYAGSELVHAGTPAHYVPEVLASLFEWLRTTDIHPLIASCIFHYEFEFIHPFSDGNGRMGRLWQTLILAQWQPVLQWLPVESVILDRQQSYYTALALSDQAGSSEVFVAFMLSAIRDALRPFVEGEHKTLEGKKSVSLNKSDASVFATRDTRSQAALAFLSTHEKATLRELASHLGTSQRTAERLVAHLKQEGHLKREGSARAGRWIVL